MPANTEPLHEANDSHNYYFRRRLTSRELLPALVIGIGAGLVGFYVARLFTQRTLLAPKGVPGAVARRRPRADGDAG
jgi:H+/Cl- antiporter ClcA